jgi:heptosyltransferase I
VINASGHYNLLELLDLLAASECVVSVNTGVVHLAAAIAVPTVCLNGPSSGTRWGPLGRLSVSVDSSLPGCGYLNLGAEYRGQREDCMCGIAVPDVLAAALEIMATARSET